MKKITITIFLIVIFLCNAAAADQLGIFENPNIYVSPTFVQLESNTFKIPNSVEIDLDKICVNPSNPIYVDDVQSVTNAFDNVASYLDSSKNYYELCFVMKDSRFRRATKLLNTVINFQKDANLPLIISGLELDGEEVKNNENNVVVDKSYKASLIINSDSFLLLHNITIDKSKQGIELNCPNGCLVANSKLTGVPASPPAVSTGIKTLGKDITIKDVIVSNFDIGIDVYSKKSLVERCEVIGNKMYGLFVHEDANLSIKSMKSMIGNGDGKSALNAFTPNSNI
ncbi:MAG: right-handed parallel beta-helix repeat-containing protein, partial [Pseudomonadota bacterium]